MSSKSELFRQAQLRHKQNRIDALESKVRVFGNRKEITLDVPMCGRDALLISGNTANAHRGIWFTHIKGIREGDTVRFRCCGKIIQEGIVVRSDLKPSDFPKYCSKLNDSGFMWRSTW